MTSPPSPPKRRRRRIVVTVAVLVLGLGWWFWPQGHVDQRLVGKWKLSVRLMNETITSRFDATGVVDGLSWRESDGWGGAGGELNWWVSGDELFVQNALPPLSDFRQFLNHAFARLVGRDSAYHFEIVELRPIHSGCARARPRS